jgi:hypothetical protein
MFLTTYHRHIVTILGSAAVRHRESRSVRLFDHGLAHLNCVTAIAVPSERPRFNQRLHLTIQRSR